MTERGQSTLSEVRGRNKLFIRFGLKFGPPVDESVGTGTFSLVHGGSGGVDVPLLRVSIQEVKVRDDWVFCTQKKEERRMGFVRVEKRMFPESETRKEVKVFPRICLPTLLSIVREWLDIRDIEYF